jgi:sensor c-di-GMP phosphodiesterase-like protein
MLWLVNPDEEILDWKAVCGKTARTVWREGRLVAFSTPIGLSVIAEGVETIQQAQYLRDNNCKGFQGYHFSKPLVADEFARQFIE